MEAPLQRDLQAVRQECDEDMGFDPVLVLMEDRPDRQIAFQVFERLLHANKLSVVLPQQCGIVLGEVGPQQIASFASPDHAQLRAIEAVDEHGAFIVHLDIDQAPCGGSAGPRRAELHQHFLTRDFHRRQLS